MLQLVGLIKAGEGEGREEGEEGSLKARKLFPVLLNGRAMIKLLLLAYKRLFVHCMAVSFCNFFLFFKFFFLCFVNLERQHKIFVCVCVCIGCNQTDVIWQTNEDKHISVLCSDFLDYNLSHLQKHREELRGRGNKTEDFSQSVSDSLIQHWPTMIHFKKSYQLELIGCLLPFGELWQRGWSRFHNPANAVIGKRWFRLDKQPFFGKNCRRGCGNTSAGPGLYFAQLCQTA